MKNDLKAMEITQVQGRNRWGLYQMHGNVWEWCEDWYDESATSRVLRGGCWSRHAVLCGSAIRYALNPGGRNRICGFRLAANPPGADVR
jgi:formylglycine-generating enzyme required for sulfatase activity